MSTLLAPEGKYLTQFENTENRIIVQEVTGFGCLNETYREASDYDVYMQNSGGGATN